MCVCIHVMERLTQEMEEIMMMVVVVVRTMQCSSSDSPVCVCVCGWVGVRNKSGKILI